MGSRETQARGLTQSSSWELFVKKELWQQNASAVQVFKTSLMEFLGREGYRRGGWVKGETFDGKQKIKENQVMREKKRISERKRRERSGDVSAKTNPEPEMRYEKEVVSSLTGP